MLPNPRKAIFISISIEPAKQPANYLMATRQTSFYGKNPKAQKKSSKTQQQILFYDKCALAHSYCYKHPGRSSLRLLAEPNFSPLILPAIDPYQYRLHHV